MFDPMQKLLDYLASIPAGPISDTADLESLLKDCWHEFSCSDTEAMAGYKLRNRMEEVVCDPPTLSFNIERHGATVLGSTRADLHEWELNVQDRVASCQTVGRRQVNHHP